MRAAVCGVCVALVYDMHAQRGESLILGVCIIPPRHPGPSYAAYMIDVRPGHAGGYYEFYHRGELEGDDEDDYDAIGGLYFEDPTHELFDFISGLEGLDEDSGWLGA